MGSPIASPATLSISTPCQHSLSREGAGDNGSEATLSDDDARGLDQLAGILRDFAQERDWEQFHSPKNLASALSVEAGELLEPFQWLTSAQSKNLSPEQLAAVQREMADVLIYLVRLADVLGVDLLEVAEAKVEENRSKYPAEQVRGRADKYTAYQ